MEQKEYWDSVSAEKTFTTPFDEEIFRSYIGKDSFVLDVGCGYGRILALLEDLGYEDLHGTDFSIGMIERGIRLHPELDLRLMEFGKIPYADESADAVILFAVLTCIASDEEQKELIEEVRRVLKPEGILYINDFLLNDDERNLHRYEKGMEGMPYGTFVLPEGAVVRHHTTEHFDELLKDFEKVREQENVFTTMNGNKSRGIALFVRK